MVKKQRKQKAAAAPTPPRLAPEAQRALTTIAGNLQAAAEQRGRVIDGATSAALVWQELRGFVERWPEGWGLPAGRVKPDLGQKVMDRVSVDLGGGIPALTELVQGDHLHTAEDGARVPCFLMAEGDEPPTFHYGYDITNVNGWTPSDEAPTLAGRDLIHALQHALQGSPDASTPAPAADPATPAAPAAAAEAPAGPRLEILAAGDMEPWPELNPRRRFDPEKHKELVGSIRKRGIRQPVAVHDRGAATKGKRYWLVAGERRLRAAAEIGPDTAVPAMIQEYSESEAEEIALIENLDRDDLTPIEEARGMKRLLGQPHMTQAKLAERLGRSQPYISNRVRLLELPDEVLALVEDGIVELTHARDLLLPFNGIPEKKRTKLFSKAAAALRKEAKEEVGRTLHEEDVANIVGHVAAALSRPLDRSSRVWDADQGVPEPLFTLKAHEKCGCKGPAYPYHYQKCTRCFDETWWDKAQEKVKAQQKAKLEKAAAAVASATGATGAIRMDADAFRKAYGSPWDMRVDAHVPLDATELADTPLVVVKESHGGGLMVCATDEKALKRARSAVTRAGNALLKERRADRAEADRAAAAKRKVDVDVLRMLLIERPYGDWIMEVGRDLGLEVGKHGELAVRLTEMPAADVELLCKVLTLRWERKESGFRDALKDAVDKEIAARFRPGINALVKKAKKAADRNGDTPADDPEEEALQEEEAGFDEAQCIRCGCTDSQACDEGCAWTVVDYEAGVGVCDACESSLEGATEALADWTAEHGEEASDAA